jgi:hypothetical protein
VKTPQQAQQAYQEAIPRGTSNFVSGVQGFSGDWAGRTTAQQSTMQQNLNTAISSGRWAQGVNRVGTNGWKSATEAKSANYGVGVNAGVPKFNSSISKILQAEGNIVGSLPPRGTYEQNKARATAVMDGLHALKGTLGAS